MKTTVLPVRDPERPERRAPVSPVSPPPDSGAGFEGLHSTSVELLRVRRKPHVPARPRALAPPPAPAPASAQGPAAVEIELPNGRVVRVPQGFSSADLARVLAIASADEPEAGERRPAGEKVELASKPSETGNR